MMDNISYVPYLFKGAWRDSLCDGFKTRAEAEAYIAEYLRKHPEDAKHVTIRVWNREFQMWG